MANPKDNKEKGPILDPVKAVKAVTDSAFVKEFKEFINRGSIVDLAIGVAVGGAFTTIVKSLVDDIIMPITGLLAGGVDFSSLSIDIPNIFGANTSAHIAYGNFLQNVVNFLVIAFTVFIVVRFINRMNADTKAASDVKDAQDAKDAKDAAVAEAEKAKKASN